MKIDHLIVGAKDVEASSEFYCELLGFQRTSDNPGAQGGLVLTHDQCELLVLSFRDESLPNPSHFAFRVETKDEFNRVLAKAEAMNLRPRSMPPRDSAPGPGELTRGAKRHKIFYVLDPAGSNVEIMAP